MARGYATSSGFGGGGGAPSFTTSVNPEGIRKSLPTINNANLFDGVLTARVTSVANTTPVQGRN